MASAAASAAASATAKSCGEGATWVTHGPSLPATLAYTTVNESPEYAENVSSTGVCERRGVGQAR